MPVRFGKALVVLFLLLPVSAWAQPRQEVKRFPDWVSYGTAAVNPATAVWKALRSSDTKCKLGQLGVSAAFTTAAVLPLKHFVLSPRPCLGCRADGMPSGHSAYSTLGLSSGWRVGLFASVATGELRHGARRHDKKQIAAGLAIGGLAELAGQKLIRCQT